MNVSTDERPVFGVPATQGMVRVTTEDTMRSGVYVVIAALAFITGFILGQSGTQAPPASRIEWPSPPLIKPHPRSLQM